MTTTPSTPDPLQRPDANRDLVVLFSTSLRILGDAGHPVAANRLAAKAWWALKDDNPKGANRVSGVMHYLAKLPEEDATHSALRTPHEPPHPVLAEHVPAKHVPTSTNKEPING